jgi:4-nitrophenyl phosphatase
MTSGLTNHPAAVAAVSGVIWLSGTPIGDVSGAVNRLTSAGVTVAFVTNNSAPTLDELRARLANIGIHVGHDDLISSSAAAASLVSPGTNVAVVGEQGLVEAIERRGALVGNDGPYGAAVVGWNRLFDFKMLSSVATAARESGCLIGTNEDPTHPTPDGLVPGAGSLLAAVATASGVTPVVAGKPHAPIVDLLRARFDLGAPGRSAVVVGDQPGTDGRLAAALGLPFALVDSGVTLPGTPVTDVAVASRTPDFVTLVERALLAAQAS